MGTKKLEVRKTIRKMSLHNKRVQRKLRVELKRYAKEHYKGFPAIMVHSQDGWLTVLHEHWKYINPVTQAPKVYLGGKIQIKPTYIWLD